MTEKYIFKGYALGLPILVPVETPRQRNLKFVITWEHAGRVGKFSCYGSGDWGRGDSLTPAQGP